MGTALRVSKVTRLRYSGPSRCSGASFKSLAPSNSVVAKLRATDAVALVVPATLITAPAAMVKRAPLLTALNWTPERSVDASGVFS